MPPVQKNKNIRKKSQNTLLFPLMSIVLPEKIQKIQESVDYHINIEEKIDAILREREKKIILDEIVTTKTPTPLYHDTSIERRNPLQKKPQTSTFTITQKQKSPQKKYHPIPEEFKHDFTDGNPSYRFVTSLDDTTDVIYSKKKGNKRVEIIDLHELEKKSGDDQKKTTKDEALWYSITSKHKDSNDMEKSKIYYFKSKTNKNKKTKDLEIKQSYIPVDFDELLQKLKNNEQQELEKQHKIEQIKTQKEQKNRKKEERKLQILEAKKERIQAKQKLKQKKAEAIRKHKQELQEKKQLRKQPASPKEKKSEVHFSSKQEQRMKKLQAKQAKLEAKQKKKQEKQALLKTLKQEAEEKKHLKKKQKKGITGDVQEVVPIVPVEDTPLQTFLDEDVIKVLLITDDLLGNLPEDVIEKFAQSEDFKLYEKVMSKYKHT